MLIDVDLITGRSIAEQIEELGQFRIAIFRDWPYLYDGNMPYERDYLSRYARCESSFVLVGRDAHGIRYACTAIPLKHELPQFQQPFLDRQMPVDNKFYLGEIMVRRELRGQGVGTLLMNKVLSTIAELTPPSTEVVLATVIRPSTHPLKPADYNASDHLWTKSRFVRMDDLVVKLDWKDIGHEQETTKEMVYWLRK